MAPTGSPSHSLLVRGCLSEFSWPEGARAAATWPVYVAKAHTPTTPPLPHPSHPWLAGGEAVIDSHKG